MSDTPCDERVLSAIAFERDAIQKEMYALKLRAERAEAENADMKSRWMDWCDSHALDRIEALQAELDRVMQAAANGGYCRRTHYPAGGTV